MNKPQPLTLLSFTWRLSGLIAILFLFIVRICLKCGSSVAIKKVDLREQHPDLTPLSIHLAYTTTYLSPQNTENMSPISSAKISDSKEAQKEALEAELQDNTTTTVESEWYPSSKTPRFSHHSMKKEKERRIADPASRRDYKTKLAQAGSKPTTAPTSVTKIINDTAYHEATISGSDLVLENFNEIDYHSPGVVQLTTTAFKGATITGGKISSGARAAPRNLA